jgi:hypothetical protein
VPDLIRTEGSLIRRGVDIEIGGDGIASSVIAVVGLTIVAIFIAPLGIDVFNGKDDTLGRVMGQYGTCFDILTRVDRLNSNEMELMKKESLFNRSSPVVNQ